MRDARLRGCEGTRTLGSAGNRDIYCCSAGATHKVTQLTLVGLSPHPDCAGSQWQRKRYEALTICWKQDCSGCSLRRGAGTPWPRLLFICNLRLVETLRPNRLWALFLSIMRSLCWTQTPKHG